MAEFIYKQIKSYIQQIIAENNGNPDFMLPSENQLAIKFKASRVSVRKAFDELEKEQVIERLKGKGTFIKCERTALDDRLTFALILSSGASFFINTIIGGATKFCRKNNIRLITLFSLDSAEMESQCIKEALAMKVQGIIIAPLDMENYSRSMLDLSIKNIPLVFVDHKLIGLGVPCISSNHYDIMFTATKYLCERGHSKVMMISSSNNMSSLFDRLSGYEAALQRFSGTFHKYVFVPDYNNPLNLNIEYRNYVTKNNITAAVCPSGDMALRFAFCMKNLNKTVNKDYEIVLIDEESYYFESMLGSKIPTIIQNGPKLGATAAETLLSIINGKSHHVQSSSIFVPFYFNI